MKLFGLKFYHPEQEVLSWKTVLLREVTQDVSSALVIGLFGVLWALFDKEERTFFDKISGIYVIKDEPRLKFIKEFRDFRAELKKRKNLDSTQSTNPA